MQSLEKTVDDFEKQNRKSALVYSTLGILEMHQGDLDRALKNLKAAQTLAPADPRINAQLGNVLRRQGNEFSAANAYETALRYERNHAEAQLGVALMALDTGKLDVARKYVDNLTSPNIEPPPSARQLALARMAKAIVVDLEDKKDEADKLEAQALETDPRNAELYILKSRRLLKNQKNDEAVVAIRKAIELEPKRASFYVDLARALVKKGPDGAKEAVNSMQQALKSMPGSPKLLVLLGDAHKASGDLQSAQAQYEKALVEAKDKLPEARMALADVARAKKDYAKATELYEKALTEYLTAPDRQAYAYTEMGRMAEEQGDAQKAVEMYKKAAGIEATYAPPYYFLGKNLHRRQGPVEAREGRGHPLGVPAARAQGRVRGGRREVRPLRQEVARLDPPTARRAGLADNPSESARLARRRGQFGRALSALTPPTGASTLPRIFRRRPSVTQSPAVPQMQ